MTANLPLRAVLPALALAATVLVAGCGDDDGPTQADDPSTSSPSPGSSAPSSDSSSSSSAATSATPGTSAYAVYDVGSTPQGARLYREFRPASGVGPSAAVALLSDPPDDPDYRTLWPAGMLSDAHLADGQIDVTVDASMAQRPSDMSAKEAKLAVQQVVYTMQAAAQQTLPVRFLSGDAPAATVLGVPTADPVTAGDQLATLALVNITTPSQDDRVSGRFTAEGVASSFEGTVPWEILDSDGTKVMHGSGQGTFDYQLTPWQAEVDVSGLAPGDYTFVAMTDDPSEGEGGGPMKDTKAFTIT